MSSNSGEVSWRQRRQECSPAMRIRDKLTSKDSKRLYTVAYTSQARTGLVEDLLAV